MNAYMYTSPYDDHDDLEEIEICWSQRFSVLLEAVTYQAYELVAHCVVAVGVRDLVSFLRP